MNFRGPLLRQIEETDPETGARVVIDREPVRFCAVAYPGQEEVEVELRVGRNGIVYAAPVEDLDAGIEAPGLPANEELHPVPPEARTTPFSVDDFAPRG